MARFPEIKIMVENKLYLIVFNRSLVVFDAEKTMTWRLYQMLMIDRRTDESTHGT